MHDLNDFQETEEITRIIENKDQQVLRVKRVDSLLQQGDTDDESQGGSEIAKEAEVECALFQ